MPAKKKYFPFFLTFLLCLPFSILAQFSYINPLPGSSYKNPETAITLRTREFISPSSNKNWITITGSKSGSHSYQMHIAQDGKTLIIVPKKIFDYDETVTVHIGSLKNQGKLIDDSTFIFHTRQEITPEMHKDYILARAKILSEEFGNSMEEKTETGAFDSVPTFKILVDDHPAEGAIFFNNSYGFENYMNCHLSIIENSGKWIWARDEGINGSDFKINRNGYFTYYNHITHKWEMLDSSYNLIDSFQCKNGYELETDPHDFQILPDRHKFMIADDAETVDMSKIVPGGQTNATVIGLIIQEQDSAGDVVFEWSSWDHFSITDVDPDIDLTEGYIDAVHGNAIEIDHDGNLLLSSRHLDEISKIDLSTGDFIWRLGGRNNQFVFVNDSVPLGFSHQHDIRRLENGDITLFNNGLGLTPQVSVAKEYALDEVNKVATLVWSYQHPPVNGYALFFPVAGNVQRLPNGNTFINWGLNNEGKGFPNMTEVTPDGKIVWEMKFDSAIMYSYRAHKYTWDSTLTGVHEVHLSVPTISVYPNPCSSLINFYFSLPYEDLVTVQVFGMSGELMFSKVERYSSGDHHLELPADSFTSGLYYFSIHGAKWRYNNKIVVIR